MDNSYLDLLKKYRELEGYNFLKQLEKFSLSFYVFDRNYKEFIKFLHSAIQISSTSHLDKDEHDKVMAEITRLLHNFVASVQTLIDNTRVYYRKEYGENGLFPDYNEEIQERFIKNNLQSFVKDLRQHFQHYRIPLISFSISITDNNGSNLNARYFFPKESLTDFDWKLRSKQYIENQCNGEVDVEKFTSEYYELTKSFYDWFIQRQVEIRKNEIDKVYESEGKLLSLQIEDEVERFINPSIKDYDPMILIKLMMQFFPPLNQEKMKNLSKKQQIDLFIKSLIDWKKINTSTAKILQEKYYEYINRNP